MELAANGSTSTLPGAPKGATLQQALKQEGTLEIRDDQILAVEKLFALLRAEADEWQAQRTAYMLERMQAGRHPDVDKTFWNDWQETDPPSLYVEPPQERRRKYINIAAAIVGTAFLSLLALKFARRKKPTPA